MAGSPPLTRNELVRGLQLLGLELGAILMVHASLSSLGHVQGGADTVIDALLDVLGPQGTLLMPTHPARDGAVFNVEKTPSAMGAITELFRLRPQVLRSRHPYHPVAACGAMAEEMLRNHEQSAEPDGPHTPYGRLIEKGGMVLHIGCDLDTLTLLHTVEAELDLPYLRELTMQYLDADQRIQTLALQRCPGGHRGGVLKFDRLFRDKGAMNVGKIGKAVCRLLSAPRAAAIMRREMERDPFFALDDNPHCSDCSRFRGQIRAAQLYREDFTLSALLDSGRLENEALLDAVQRVGISHIDLKIEPDAQFPGVLEAWERRLRAHGMQIAAVHLPLEHLPAGWPDGPSPVWCLIPPDQQRMNRTELANCLGDLAQRAAEKGRQLALQNGAGSAVETAGALAEMIQTIGSPSLAASYDPAVAAGEGRSPFYGDIYQGRLRAQIRHVHLRDVAARTRSMVPPGRGYGELAEIISNLRCRSFDGIFCLWPLPEKYSGGDPVEAFRLAAQAFWEIMGRI